MSTRRISRREAITAGLAGAAASAALGACGNGTGSGTEEAPAGNANASQAGRGIRAVVVGAGAFGGWTALWLRRAGAEVTLVDAWGPGNSRASSGGETRLIRASYGPRRVYSAMVARSLEIWKEHQARWDDRLFFPVGMLRMSSGASEYSKAAVPILRELGLAVEELDGEELARRFPQINPEGLSYALFESDAGYLLARRGCERVLRDFLAEGGTFRRAEAVPGTTGGGRMRDIRLADGSSVEADLFVFACGPWLARLFPEFDPPLVRPPARKCSSSVRRRAIPSCPTSRSRPGSTRAPSTASRGVPAVVSRSRTTPAARLSIPPPATGRRQRRGCGRRGSTWSAGSRRCGTRP